MAGVDVAGLALAVVTVAADVLKLLKSSRETRARAVDHTEDLDLLRTECDGTRRATKRIQKIVSRVTSTRDLPGSWPEKDVNKTLTRILTTLKELGEMIQSHRRMLESDTTVERHNREWAKISTQREKLKNYRTELQESVQCYLIHWYHPGGEDITARDMESSSSSDGDSAESPPSSDQPEPEIIDLTRSLHANTIRALLCENGGLSRTQDRHGRTLMDVAISFGSLTEEKLQATFDILREYGIPFTLTDVDLRRTWETLEKRSERNNTPLTSGATTRNGIPGDS